MILFRHRKMSGDKYEYDPSLWEPVLRCSICTGEQVAGFRSRESGVFRDVQLITCQKDAEEFMDRCGVNHLEKIY